ncbi:hypothetical protein Deipr_2501 (plasmid) [Deinococcus proteolyticus MRP]|uniref:TrbL/VirB6 plasmid conjugal transfer protein n=1 Tax=Deinococcus proteolyticus (strain ATCC 35074 / DSM 20540 / JCM 6276 / NBRC 101906 / NCIMB 13154 / VKM Ac-1939 / CCM 2703 / MRP) TaxID=693977 RepID=F0RQQ9_DEIPM|nr:hypothetical protein [Deinococcus proteolyticus]ADY27618.1 hypothetical protein Deipr_2501 [Deinococcus proteolyticus MRP]
MNVKALRTALFVLVLALGVAEAAGCVSEIPSAAEQRINLESFVPDPGCWIYNTLTQLEEYGVPGFAESVGKGLLFAGAAFAMIRALSTNSWNQTFLSLLYSGIAFTMINGYGAHSGPGYTIAKTFLDGWQSLYVASASMANEQINTTVIDGTKAISAAMWEYTASVAEIQANQQIMEVMGNFEDPAALENIVDYANERALNRIDGNNIAGDLTPASWAFVLLLGIYGIFAAIVFSSGLMMTLLVMLFPLFVAITALGQKRAAWNAFSLAVGQLLVIMITPAMMNIMLATTMKAPLASMQQSLEVSANQAKNQVMASRQNWEECKTLFAGAQDVAFSGCFDTALNGVKKLQMFEFIGSTLYDSVMGIVLGVIAIVISFSILILQIRRVPAVVMQVMGAMGGGESSGVGSNPVAGAMSSAGSSLGGNASGMVQHAATKAIDSKTAGAATAITKVAQANGWGKGKR